jgi:undecaprenyl-diphosphatase
MDAWYAILKGMLQGATEFIPVSSSAHLVLFRTLTDILGYPPPNPFVDEFFDITLHLGTLLAVLIYFRHEITRFIQAVVYRTPTVQDNNGQVWQTFPLLWGGFLAFSVTSVFALVGLKGSEVLFAKLQHWPLLNGVPDMTQFYIHHPEYIALNLFLTGCLLAFAEKQSAKATPLHEASTEEALHLAPLQVISIGVAQSVAAIFRGISRSGSTMATALLCGLSRPQAARFSFWLSIPIFGSAAVYESYKLAKVGIAYESLPWVSILLGMFASFVVGYACIAWLLKLLVRFPLTVFSYYCWALSIGMFVYFRVAT